jgi:hypothetical protein
VFRAGNPVITGEYPMTFLGRDERTFIVDTDDRLFGVLMETE